MTRYNTLMTSIIGVSVLLGSAAAQNMQSVVTTTIEPPYRIILSNGIPNHRVGQFPNRNNPNTIAAQEFRFRIQLKPEARAQSSETGHHLFGVAVNGIPFDPGTAEFWNRNPQSGWRYEALSGRIALGVDGNNAHVQPGGMYHYHGIPTGLVKQLARPDSMVLTGYAADGFPIYAKFGYTKANDPESGLIALRSSYVLRQGLRRNGPGGPYDGTFVEDFHYVSGAGELDECNGRFGVTPDYPDGTYYYMLTETFPFVPRRFRGTPDSSFQKRGPGGPGGPGMRPRGGHRPPPPPGHRPPPRP